MLCPGRKSTTNDANWTDWTEDCAFRKDSEKISAVLDLLHDRRRGLFSQLETTGNKDGEEGKSGLLKKLTSPPLDMETPGEVSKVRTPPIGARKQS